MFTPMSGCVLVKLDTSPYKYIDVEKGEYDAQNIGTIIDHGEYPDLEDKKIIWTAYKEKDAMFGEDGGQYALIDYDQIRGVS